MQANEPAFPLLKKISQGDASITEVEKSGLTKREVFAAFALQGAIATSELGPDEAAKYAVKAADALLKRLEAPTD